MRHLLVFFIVLLIYLNYLKLDRFTTMYNLKDDKKIKLAPEMIILYRNNLNMSAAKSTFKMMDAVIHEGLLNLNKSNSLTLNNVLRLLRLQIF